MNTVTCRAARAATVAALAAVLLVGCGSSSSSSTGTAATTAAATTTATASATLKITGVWARTSAANQMDGAAYMKIENTTDKEDALTGVTVDATVATKAELHETVAAGAGSDTTMAGAATTADAMSATTAMGAATTAMGSATTAMGGGAMMMRPVDKIVVPAKGSVELKPGGYHVMLITLAKPLALGQSFDLTLTFASGAKQVVKAEVLDQP